MVAEFSHYFHMTFSEIYQMPAQMFFVYYRQIVRVVAGHMVNQVNSITVAKAIQYAEQKDKRKVDREFKKMVKLSKGQE